jgi:putative transferase (TIGR04331 family)
VTQKHLVTGPFSELWRDTVSAVVIDGIGLDGKVFVDDPSVAVTLVKSPEILSQVDDAEFAEFQAISESVFQNLVRELNRVHGTNHPVRFWRIVCGAWFLQFAQVWYLRWKVASEVVREHGAMPCRRIDIGWQELLPVTHDEASLLFATDLWNHIAYCDAFKFVARSSQVETAVASPDRNQELFEYREVINYGLPGQSAKSKLESVLAKISPRPKVVLAGVVQSRAALVAMHLRLGVLPRLWRFSAKLTPQPVNASLRGQLSFSGISGGGFAEFLGSSISRHLPTVYLEGFGDLCTQTFSENILPKPPRVIFTNTLLHRSEQFKLWSATFVIQGKTKLLSGQHGGGYGVYKYQNWSEIYENSVVDNFLSWAKGATSSVDLGTCVQADSNSYRPDFKGDLLVVLGPVTRQQNNFNLGNTHCNSSYYTMLKQFLFSLKTDLLPSVVIRPKNASAVSKPARLSTKQISEVLDGFENLDAGKQSLEQSLSSCRLAVVTYNETTIPTNMMNEFPTIALWDPKYVRLNSQAEIVYHQMHEAKILFYSPQLAAEHITQIWSDVEGWWNSAQVRLARENYCNHYAHRVRFPALTVASVIADNL